jgi:hypothetical protein
MSERGRAPSVAPPTKAIVASNLVLEAELVRLVSLLKQAAIPCIVLKGVPLARRLHDCIDQRAIGDNDLLVRAVDARRACHLLERDGYRGLPFLELERRLRTTNQHLLYRRDGQVTRLVEIHWNAFSRRLFRVPEHVQWAHTAPFSLRGALVEVFDPALTLSHLAAHFAQHGFAELRILRDLARAWDLWCEPEGSHALSLADSIGLRPALEFALQSAAMLGWLRRSAPPAVSSRRARALLRLLPKERLRDEPALQTTYTRRLLALLVGHPRAIPRSTLRNLFPPPDELASLYGIPIDRRLYPRYVGYWLRPAGRLLRRLRSS